MDDPRSRLAAVNWRAVSAGLFLPLLYWVGAVTAISMFGYPGVVCITPAAWLLALPVGMRIGREIAPGADDRSITTSALAAGAMLGLFQALLLAAMLSIAPTLPGGAAAAGANALISPWWMALIAGVIGIPITAGLAVLAARMVRKN